MEITGLLKVENIKNIHKVTTKCMTIYAKNTKNIKNTKIIQIIIFDLMIKFLI